MRSINKEATTSNHNILVLLILYFFLMFGIFTIDLLVPLGVAGGVPYVVVILVSLWLNSYKYTISLAVICTILTLIGFYYSPAGGELWKVVANRGLAIFAIWLTAILAIKWEITLKRNIALAYEAERKKETEKIYIATIGGALHIINNLLNNLQIVEFEIENTPEFDGEVKNMFDAMRAEASSQTEALSSVNNIEAAAIIASVHPGLTSVLT